jgi:hypothetical protein
MTPKCRTAATANYFDNRGVSKVGETIEALRTLGLECQADVLMAARERRRASTSSRPDAPPGLSSIA